MKKGHILFICISLFTFLGCADSGKFTETNLKLIDCTQSAISRLTLSIQTRSRMGIVNSADDIEKLVNRMNVLLKEMDMWGLNADQKATLRKNKAEIELWDEVVIKVRGGEIDDITKLFERMAKL